jgi:hypothetical protein
MRMPITETVSYATGLELRAQAMEATIQQLGEALEHVRPKLQACVVALEAWEKLEQMVTLGAHPHHLRDAHEEAATALAAALHAVRSVR